MSSASTGSATITIARPPAEVWAAIADITRMGEWSPECTGGRWVAPAARPEVGARFEGDNVAMLAGRTLKKWTTTSMVTACEPGVVFAFLVEDTTTWTYSLAPKGDGTEVTETFEYVPSGFQGFLYDTVLRRPKAMTKGMQHTLERIKEALES